MVADTEGWRPGINRASLVHVRSINPDRVNRHPDDYYRTPRRATDALLRVEAFPGRVWEPACGDGAISEALIAAGCQVRSTDLVYRGFGTGGVDFLRPRPVDHPTCNCVVTNPPFKLTQQFVECALAVSDTKVAILARLLWLEGGKRMEFFQRSPFKGVLVFGKRINVAHGGDPRYADGKGGMVAFAWFLWQHGYTGAPAVGWL